MTSNPALTAFFRRVVRCAHGFNRLRVAVAMLMLAFTATAEAGRPVAAAVDPFRAMLVAGEATQAMPVKVTYERQSYNLRKIGEVVYAVDARGNRMPPIAAQAEIVSVLGLKEAAASATIADARRFRPSVERAGSIAGTVLAVSGPVVSGIDSLSDRPATLLGFQTGVSPRDAVDATVKAMAGVDLNTIRDAFAEIRDNASELRQAADQFTRSLAELERALAALRATNIDYAIARSAPDAAARAGEAMGTFVQKVDGLKQATDNVATGMSALVSFTGPVRGLSEATNAMLNASNQLSELSSELKNASGGLASFSSAARERSTQAAGRTRGFLTDRWTMKSTRLRDLTAALRQLGGNPAPADAALRQGETDKERDLLAGFRALAEGEQASDSSVAPLLDGWFERAAARRAELAGAQWVGSLDLMEFDNPVAEAQRLRALGDTTAAVINLAKALQNSTQLKTHAKTVNYAMAGGAVAVVIACLAAGIWWLRNRRKTNGVVS